MNAYEKLLPAMNALTEVASEHAKLERENKMLVEGTASQAATIRKLRELVSNLEAEVNLEKYNVEFLKQQGRKTRAKTRELRKSLKAAKAEVRTDKRFSLEEVQTATFFMRSEIVVLRAEKKKLKDQLLAFQYGSSARPATHAELMNAFRL